MTSTEHVIARIRAFAKAQGWTKTRLAKEAGLHANTLRDYEDEGWNPRLETLQSLERLLPTDPASNQSSEAGEAA